VAHWWAETHERVLEILGSSLNGLEVEEAEKFGLNEVEGRESRAI